jgi:hypothetical protein
MRFRNTSGVAVATAAALLFGTGLVRTAAAARRRMRPARGSAGAAVGSRPLHRILPRGATAPASKARQGLQRGRRVARVGWAVRGFSGQSCLG